MDYRVFDLKSRAPLDTLELHVLARAYYAAWRAVHGTTPESRHPMPMLNAFFDFNASPTEPLQHHDSAAQSGAATPMAAFVKD
jgi:hypothetical protein